MSSPYGCKNRLFRLPARLAAGIFVWALLSASAPRGANRKPTVESIGDQVMCLCGCVATLNHCPHHDCSTVVEMRPVIEKEIAQGKDETAILQDLAIRYGVQVLAAPPAKGFNLTAWILPALGLSVSLIVVAVVVRRWRKLSATVAAKPGPASVDPKLRAAVEAEMKTSGFGTGG
jgi:cytochrome c-type biogenesis protein CcmH/NrfF